MFEGSATQYLCILESLSDSNRRILITSPPAPDSDVEILDVYAELFMAAQEILLGRILKFHFGKMCIPLLPMQIS